MAQALVRHRCAIEQKGLARGIESGNAKAAPVFRDLCGAGVERDELLLDGRI